MNKSKNIDDNSLILGAWQRYLDGSNIDTDVVRQDILSSWQRCQEMKVDPMSNTKIEIKKKFLNELIKRKLYLINISLPFMKRIYDSIRGTGFQIVLCDEDGCLLKVMGDPRIIKRTRQVQLSVGGIWSERLKGTNAIGTAIAERRPVQVHSAEHFCKSNHFLTCSASPIFDPEGQLIGVLDVTGDCRFASPHTLGMVVSAVTAIEQQLRQVKFTTKTYFDNAMYKAIINSINDPIISMDIMGNIIKANKKALAIIPCQSESLESLNIKDLIDNVSMVSSVSNTNKNKKEFFIEISSKKFFASQSPLFDDSDKIVGSTLQLKEIKHKEVQKKNLAFQAEFTFADIIGNTEHILKAKEIAMKAARSSSTVLILGESGTGKELFAHAIHNASDRCDKPFIVVHCAAIPETLIESELFGYEEGAFSGAKKGGQAGKFEQANGGTIFLDEIGEMPPATQVKLLRVLQVRKITRLGAAQEKPVDIRVISATNKDLQEGVKKGTFRKDLYYRINVIPIKIPPLREQIANIPILAQHFLTQICSELGREGLSMSDEFINALLRYDWPGNIRELRCVIERAVNLVDDNCTIGSEYLFFEDFYQTDSQQMSELQQRKDFLSLGEIEKDTIVNVLRHCEGNVTLAASRLRIGRTTLYRKLKVYNITPAQ